MLFHVRMDVSMPPTCRPMSPMKSNRARKRIRKSFSVAASGVISGASRVSTANYSIFDVQKNAELHDILLGLPLFPYMKISVTPLCRHPSSVRDGDE